MRGRKDATAMGRGLVRLGVLAAAVAACGIAAGAYSVSSYKWADNPVIVYVNPANADVSTSAAEAAVKVGLNAWNTQAGTPFRYQYGGRVSDTATANDRRNVVLFRNVSNGSTVASTYSWWSGGVRVDSDIVFWDGGITLFTGTSGCSSGVYIEDFATHELGHAMGLGHSSVASATMYPSTRWCAQSWRTLDADDIAGARKLYGTGTAPANTAPTVSIASPAASGVFAEGASIGFSGSASDAEDGNLTAQLVWTSTLQGQIGTGGAFSRTLLAGAHTIQARVSDGGSLSSSKSVQIVVEARTSEPEPVPTPTPTPTPTRTLTVRGYKVKGVQHAELVWGGFTGTTVDLYRDGTRLTSTNNDGFHTDNLRQKGGGSHTYRACEAGTNTCSGNAQVSF